MATRGKAAVWKYKRRAMPCQSSLQKTAQRKPKQASWNRLHSSFLSKSKTEFWKSWKQTYGKSRSDLHTVVNGVCSKTEIADYFKNHFMKVSRPNNQQRVNCLKDSFAEQYQEAIAGHTLFLFLIQFLTGEHCRRNLQYEQG